MNRKEFVKKWGHYSGRLSFDGSEECEKDLDDFLKGEQKEIILKMEIKDGDILLIKTFEELTAESLNELRVCIKNDIGKDVFIIGLKPEMDLSILTDEILMEVLVKRGFLKISS